MFFRHLAPAFAWFLFIIFLTFMPGDELSPVSLWEEISFDKLVHFSVYCIFSLLLIIGLKKQTSFRFLKKNAILLSLCMAISLGVLTELAQYFLVKQRFAEVFDVLANTLGAMFGVVVFKLLYYNNK